ncbi:MAG: type II secretion system F family protein [Acidimicrobiales bacterium]
MSLVLITLLVFTAVAMVVWDQLSSSDDRRRVKLTLRSLDEAGAADARERELAAPAVQRILRPIGRTLTNLGRGAMPSGSLERLRRKLAIAGRPGNDDLDRFRATRVLSYGAVIPALVILSLVPLTGRTRLIVMALAVVALVLGPDAVLSRQMDERRHQIRSRLPDLIDLLRISVEAGLGFDQALERTVDAVPGPLSEEFRRLLGEIRAGADRAEAFRALDARTDVPELRSFVLALIQADTFGVSISRILKSQAAEMRVKRRQLAQEAAQKAPVKLLFPMVLCIFPGLFVVLLGPAFLNFANAQF